MMRHSRTPWHLSVVLLVALAGMTCSVQATEWTFMVYLDADNNLEPFGVDDFMEMSSVSGLTGGAGASVRVLVQFDRTPGEDTRYGDWTSTKRFEVTTGKTPTAANQISDLGEANMGSAATLKAFIEWGIGYAPASKYALVLWNHGGGWRNRGATAPVVRDICWDDSSGGACLYTKDMRTVLEQIPTQLDVLACDACLMAMLEVAYEVKAEAKVFVASEQTEGADGYPYNTILTDLVATPAMDAAALGTVIVNRYGQSSCGPDGTQSAVDLSKIGQLATDLSAFADAAVASDTDWTVIGDARAATGYYTYDEYRDLKGFIAPVAANAATSASVKTAAQTVLDNLNNSGVIIRNYSSAGNKGTGISIYFPAHGGSVDSAYTTTNILFAEKTWDEFLNVWSGSTLPPPANDNFASAIALSGASVTTTGSNVNATKETDEPNHGGNAGGKSVWWSWQAPASGDVSVATTDSTYDTLLAVYTWNSTNPPFPSNVALIAGNDDYPPSSGSRTSLVTFTATAGTTYYIAVDGYAGASGSISLNVHVTVRPGNDMFANSIALSGESTSTTGTNVDATFETGEPQHANQPGGVSVWWKWTAPSSGLTTISTAGSNFDTLLAVYTGTAVTGLTLVASNDDYGVGRTSQVSFDAVSGTEYQIAVDGYRAAMGDVALSISLVSRVATPGLSPGPGAFVGSVDVTISCATSLAEIHYTTDGSTPTSGSAVYAAPVTLTQTGTVKAVALKDGLADSKVNGATYTIQPPPPVATPTFDPAGGSYANVQDVSILCSTASATIYYTTDGSIPTTASAVYGGPIRVGVTTTLKALGVKADMTDSDVGTATYTLPAPVAAPTFSPAGGSYTSVQMVTVASATDGATIYYTTNGSTPTASSLQYSEPIRVAMSLTLKAFAVKSGMADSEVTSAAYTLPSPAARPTFSPPAGSYVDAQNVTLACATEGAAIYYTTDGNTPTTASAQYADPISVTTLTTIKAFAAKDGMLDSDVASARYTIGPTPQCTSGPTVVTPVAVGGQPVQITCATDQSGLTWTWNFGDGTSETTSSGTATHTYTAPGSFTVTLTATNSGGQTMTKTLTVTVVAAGSVSNSKVDSDGDGFPNELEEAFGSSPVDAASAPLGATGGAAAQALALAKMGIKLSFSTGGKDSISLSGTLPVPAGFVVAQQQVGVDVGGVVKQFTLDAKGKSPKGNDSFKISIKAKKGVVATQNAKFMAKLNKGTFASALADEGLTDAQVKDARVTVPVLVIFNGQVFTVDQAQLYTAAPGKTGRTKMPKK